MELKIKIIDASGVYDSSFKYEFVDPEMNMTNAKSIKLILKKVENSENEYTFKIPIPNNAETGQKELLIIFIDPAGQESSLFRIPITIILGRSITENSIICRTTEDIMAAGRKNLFKCNIDNIETSPVYYKAKIGAKDDYGHYEIDTELEEIGLENEFNVLVDIPDQYYEKHTISFAMIRSSDDEIIKYFDLSDVRITIEPNIEKSSSYYNVEKFSLTKMIFKVKYICDFQTLRVLYRNSDGNEEFQNVIIWQNVKSMVI
ncbi:hypothetical protein TVAG_088490 [Trichomonas vaginalis G3]|uniref:Uncharacterized protein n=1 Tax=Trichomonas vaginalis (strain ATCC PRA-98 / G3) TaxID=412133 RepID=A2EAZ4_TRIV3|nr:hypothetical protein TVAGG3_0398190 [Trichomonas vaginalis G3]EAY10134.1 hypothetical protein TVAG_088490 [Trichomonas vaginalis G3]KAI5534491.1 hypothetical protein TVAGG3_0398190 [Trichomonas vaginalis G3]|eukprot:XP_001322357.1 hypothetical protein [Trichomonas vaginalis G3]